MVAAPPPVPLAIAFRDPAHGSILGPGDRVRIDSPCPRGTQQSYASLSWTLCLNEGGAGNQGKSVYRRAASRWKRVAYTPFPQRSRGYGAISVYGYPVGISMAADGFGVIWESRGTLYVTRDGGSHWTGLPMVARPEVDFGQWGRALPHGVAYVLLSRGGGANRRLVETRDAGRTWRVVHRWP